MAITHPTAVRNTIADHVVDKIDAGGGAGKLELLTAGDVVVATLLFPATAFGNGGASVAGRADLVSIISDPNCVGNASPVTKFSIKNFANTEIISGTVTVSGGGGDITLPNVTISAGDVIVFGAGWITYTAPP